MSATKPGIERFRYPQPILRPSGRIAREPLADKFIEISAPHAPLVAPESGKIVPAEDSRGMHVVEYQPNGIVADRLDLEDGDVALAGDRLALVRGMPLDFGARAVDAQEFGRKFERLVGVEDNREGRLVLAKPQLGRPRRAYFRYGRHLGFLYCCCPVRHTWGPTWDRGRPARQPPLT